MDKREILAFTKGMKGAAYDCPFEKDPEITVLRHKDTKRWFGIVLAAPNRCLGMEPRDGETVVLNIKVPPELSVLLRENYRGIQAAYHMNKTHWITVVPNSDVPDEETRNLLKLSFDLTDKRSKK